MASYVRALAGSGGPTWGALFGAAHRCQLRRSHNSAGSQPDLAGPAESRNRVADSSVPTGCRSQVEDSQFAVWQ
jgi:hypothetical protein